MEITQVIRRRRAAAGQPSLRAQILLVVSAFLCGTVLAALLFVGIWRHTAADGARAHVQQAADHRLVLAARHRIDGLTARLARDGASLAAARRRETAARTALASERAALRAAARALPPRLATLDAGARALSSKLSTLQSELAAIEQYLRQPGPAGVDPGYLSAQTRYLAASADAAGAAAAAVVQDSHAAQAAAATLGRR